MENVGALSVLLAFCLTVFSIAAAITGKYARRPFLAISAERAVYAVWALLTLASCILISLLIQGDYRIAYVAAHTDKAMPTVYKFTAWWGGQQGSLLFWSWLLSTYSAVAVFTNRRKFRDMMPLVVAIMMATLAFFIGMVTFVASPFQVLMAGRGIIDVGRWQRIESAVAVVDHGHPPAISVPGLRRFHGSIRLCDGVFDHSSTRRRLDSHDPPLGNRHVAIPKYRNPAGHGLGVYSARLGRILGLGSGRKRVPNAVDYRDGLPAFGDDAGKEGHDEGLEHGSGLGHVPA